MRAVGLGGDQQAGGVLVEAMHDAGPLDAADARKRRAAVGDQRIDQRAGRMPGRGMHGEALGLVDDDEVRVLVDDGERDGLRLGCGRLGRRHAHGVGLAGLHPVAEVVLDLRRRASPLRRGSAPAGASG